MISPTRLPVSVDLFAGGGGASEGIRRALGRCPIVAVNHDPHAIMMHARNHPATIHLQTDVHDVRPAEVMDGRPLDLLWLSPDCTHHSRARGGKPRRKEFRDLAWVALPWARLPKPSRPRVIALENVPEFVTWGPLDEHGRIIASRKGETFREFVGALEAEGYVVEWRTVVACDYGAPTTRKRLFLIARCDGKPIIWPEPTHGPGRAEPYRTAAECIDWSIPCPSIFGRARPLAEKTMARIAEGLRRYVLENPNPFLLNVTHGGRLEPLEEPFRTITAANRGEKALVTPYVATIDHQSSAHRTATSGAAAPLSAVTTKARHVVCAPTLIQTGYGERSGQRPRALDIEAPLGTVVGGGSKHALVATWLAKHNGKTTGQPADVPLHSVTGRDTKALCAAHLTKFYGTSTGSDLHDPAPTVTAGGGKGGGHAGLVAAFLMKYYGAGGQWQSLDEPLHTIVAKARFGLVTVKIAGEEYAVVDIGMRMLQPRELARAQGFDDDYVLIGTKSEQIARIGNSVCPQVVEALVAAQFQDVEFPAAQPDLWSAAP